MSGMHSSDNNSTIPSPDVEPVKPAVLDADDIMAAAPFLKGHPRIVRTLMKWLAIDKVNRIHADNCAHRGHEFTSGLLRDLDLKVIVDNEGVLDQFPEGPFITVSNHPFGALDGIILIDIVTRRRPDYKVMVNLILNHIGGMRSNFIAVDPIATDDPVRRAVSVKGLKEAIAHVRAGHPLGFFPAGAVAKVNNRLRLVDRDWQENIIRLIAQLKVPVIPIFFHGSNSWWFNLLGRISWQLRTLRLPAEVFNKRGKTFHVSVGTPISPEEQKLHSASLSELSAFLRQATFSLRDNPKH